MSEINRLGSNAHKLDKAPAFVPYSRVVVWYDEENAFVSGDESGRTLECDCPFATQEIADKILAEIAGYAYQPFEAESAILDPAAELGDGVAVGGVYSVLGRCETVFNALMTSDIAAPMDEEIDHEIPYQPAVQRQLRRKLTLGKRYYGVDITKANGIEIVKVRADGREVKRAMFNADELAMYNDSGRRKIYFDTESGEFFFAGLVQIDGGSLNINDKFVVDEDGNATLTDAYLKAAMLFAGDDSQYYARMLGDAFALMNKDSEVPRAVLQADTTMVELVLGAGSDAGGYKGRLFVQKGVEGGENVARVLFVDAYGDESSIYFSDSEGMVIESGKISFRGEVDFSDATVTGLDFPSAEG